MPIAIGLFGGMGAIGMELSKVVSSHTSERVNNIVTSFVALLLALVFSTSVVWI